MRKFGYARRQDGYLSNVNKRILPLTIETGLIREYLLQIQIVVIPLPPFFEETRARRRGLLLASGQDHRRG